MRTSRACTGLLFGVLAACSPDSGAPRSNPASQPAVVPAEAQPTSLSDGAASADEIAEKFLRAIQERDTTAVNRLHITRAEFSFLVYPTHPQAQPPYSLPADVMWMMTEAASAKGLERVVAAVGRQNVRVEAVSCSGVSSHGRNRVHSGCAAIARDPQSGDEVRIPLGDVLEREGQFKFASFGAG